MITVNLDDPDNSAVAKFLGKSRATTMANFFSSYGVGPAAFTAFQIDDGALPHVRLYDRQGKLHRTFKSGGKAIDPGQVERAVEEMLKDDKGGQEITKPVIAKTASDGHTCGNRRHYRRL